MDRLSRSSAVPTEPSFVYSTTRPILHKSSGFLYLSSLSCQNSFPRRPTRRRSRPSVPSQRMLSGKQTRDIQVSSCDSLNIDRGVYRTPVLTRCPDGDGPSHPRPLHPVSICRTEPQFASSNGLGLGSSMLIRRAQSGLTATVSYFLMGTLSLAALGE